MSSRSILIKSENLIKSSPVWKHFGRLGLIWKTVPTSGKFLSSCAPVNLPNHAISDKITTVSIVVSLHNEYSKTSLHREQAMLKIWADRSLLWERTRLIKLTIPIHATELQANWREFLCRTRSTLLVDIAIRAFRDSSIRFHTLYWNENISHRTFFKLYFTELVDNF